MSKLKTRKAMAKRFKITGRGKILHRRTNSGCGHLRRKKSKRTRRQHRKPTQAQKYYLRILQANIRA